MSKLISDLLEAKEPFFGTALRQFENLTGRPGADVRLTAEIIGKTRIKMTDLGLDPEDTTGEELYLALQNRLKQHDQKLLQTIGQNEKDDLTSVFEKIKSLLDSQPKKRCWVLKKETAQELIKQYPPSKVIETLGHQNVDSMLEAENIYEIFAATRFVESPAWIEEFLRHYKSLNSNNFEDRDVEIIVMSPDRWRGLANDFIKSKKHNVTHLKELGVVAILPLEDMYRPGLATMVLAMILHYFNEVKLYSTYFKIHQTRSDFAKIIQNAIEGEPLYVAKVTGQQVHWRVLQRYYGRQDENKFPKVTEPYLRPENLYWHRAERVLSDIEPELGWWHDLSYVGVMSDRKPVVFNLIDNAISLFNNDTYANRHFRYFRDSLWSEFFNRYLGEDFLEIIVLNQLGESMTTTEVVKLTSGRKIRL